VLVAAVPAVAAALLALRTPWRTAAIAAAFLLACAPMAGFFAAAGSPHDLRYAYLPSAVLVGLLAQGPRWLTATCVLAALPALVAVRLDVVRADRESAAMHRAVQREAAEGAAAPMFVAGLPHANAAGSVVQLHFGVDRMLAPPFGPGTTRLYALRPLAEFPGVVRLWPPAGMPFALPMGSTWFFADATALGRAPDAPLLPELVVTGDTDGVIDCASARLLEAARHAVQGGATAGPSFGLRTPGVRPQGFRVTILTANGYLACLCVDHGLGAAGEGSLDVLRFLAGDEHRGIAPAVYATAGTSLAGEALVVPTTIDLDPAFPVLVEAGAMQGSEFVPSHRARRLVTFRFDRGYPAWVRTMQGRS
jgi:hypothetical protein